MRLSALCAALLLFLSGCVTEEEGCFYDEDCGEGFICDTATGVCLPVEEGDAYPADKDQTLPDTAEVDIVDVDIVTDDGEKDDKDINDIKEEEADGDTAVADEDMIVTDDTDTIDADTIDIDAVDADIVDTDTTDVDNADDDIVEVDAVPDADAACNSCTCEDCSGHGACTTANGYVECLCDTGYAGGSCQQCDIEWQDHNGDGICEADNCVNATDPIDGWLDCGAHGVCTDWSFEADCDCDLYWTDMNGECDYCFASDPNDCN